MHIPRVKIMPAAESTRLRSAYLAAFIDTAGEWYQRTIATPRQFSDGLHTDGYLWDCLRGHTRLPESQLATELQRHADVYALADDLSRERAPGAVLWPFAPGSVISLPSALLWQLLPALPMDLYVFDASVSWTLVLTHEDDGKDRIIVTSTPAT